MSDSTYLPRGFLLFCAFVSLGSLVMALNPSRCIALLVLLLLSGCASQLEPSSTYRPPPGAALHEIDDVDTGELKPTVGHEGDQVGAKVIGTRQEGDEQVVDIEVPVDPDSVDRVEVYSTGSDSVVLTREAQIIQNYETNNVGISVRVPNSENLGFRLKLIDHPDNDEWPPRRYQ